MLVKYGANVNLQDASKATPLHLAATKGHTEMASFLLNKGAHASSPVLQGSAAVWRRSYRRSAMEPAAAREGTERTAAIASYGRYTRGRSSV